MSELDTELATNKTATTDETLTEYVVLSAVDPTDSPYWNIEGAYRARTGPDAIRDCLEGRDNIDGTFAAVPARSWRPVRVRTQQTVTLKIEDAP